MKIIMKQFNFDESPEKYYNLNFRPLNWMMLCYNRPDGGKYCGIYIPKNKNYFYDCSELLKDIKNLPLMSTEIMHGFMVNDYSDLVKYAEESNEYLSFYDTRNYRVIEIIK